MLANMFKIVIALLILLSLLFSSSNAQTCRAKTSFANNLIYKTCNDLPYQNSFIYYNHDASSGNLQIAYRHTGVTSSNWVSWAINPNGLGAAMVGAQALVAYQQSNGTMRYYWSNIIDYNTKLVPSDIKYNVSDLSAVFEGGEMIIYATLQLPPNTNTINQVWQFGPVSGDTPAPHSLDDSNKKSKGTLNLVSGQAGSSGGVDSRQKKRNIHGVLNAVSWGVLIPVGVMIARYVKVFESADPAWFYLHITCQTSGYVIGVAGWATGIKLGSDSALDNDSHRNIGITLFAFATLQVFALLLRPKKDHKYRFYWNIYHHSIGYTVIILSIINIFKGFDILNPDGKWKHTYVGIIASLGIIAAFLEAYTWFIVLKRKKMEKAQKHGMKGAHGTNGYGVDGYGVRV